MPYTPDATDTTQPADAGVKASTAAAEFRALKSYIKNNILGGTVAFTGNPTVPLLPAADATAKIASAAFVQQEITRLTGLVVNSAGNVGIGTSSPTSKLAVAGDVRALSGGALILNNPANAGAGSILFNASDALVFNRGGSVESVRIDSNGNVGIGTTSPANVAGYGVVDVRGTNGGFYVIGTTAGGAVGRYGLNSSTGAVELNSFNANPLTFLTSSTERVRIAPTGNVGVNTTSPNTKLEVANSNASSGLGTGEAVLTLRNTNTTSGSRGAGIRFDLGSYTSGAAQIDLVNGASGNEGNLYFSTRTSAGTISDRFILDSSGNVLIGTYGGTVAAGCFFEPSSIGYGRLNFVKGTASGTGNTNAMAFYYSGTNVGSVQCSSTATTYATSSDVRLKTHIADAPDAGALIDAIRVRSFDWRSGDGHQRYGFIAQELVEVAPEAVVTGDSGETIVETWGVDPSKLVPLLVKELQSLRQRIAALESA